MINIKHIAKLANLTLSPKELKTYTKQLTAILGYIDKLSQINTSQIKPTFQTIDNTTNIWRQDKVKKSLSQKQALSQAKKKFQGYFVAENVFSKTDKKIAAIKDKPRKKLDKYNAVLTQVNSKGKLGHKDLFLTKNIETTAGAKILEGYIPQYSATIVKQLENAGYITKNKLNQDAWAHGSSGENSDFYPTKNPWDLTKVPGGSSSGSAAAVASGMVDIATGTDTCGSIRLPSSFTNTCGLKPTYGALSRYGVIAFASSLDCPGFFAKSVSQLKKVFQQTSQPDSYDAVSQSQARQKKNKTKVKTIGLPKEFFTKGIDKQVKQAVEQAADLFKNKGYKIKQVSLPHSDYSIAAYYVIAPTEASSNLARYDGIRYGNDRQYFGAEAKRRIMLGSFASSAGYTDKYYEQAAKIRTLIIKDFQKAFEKIDVILAPTAPTPAFKLGEKTADPLQMYLMDIYTAPVSLAGLPSLAIPCGFTKNKLPIGMQLIGSRWTEDMLFDLGEQYQQETNYHTLRPNKI